VSQVPWIFSVHGKLSYVSVTITQTGTRCFSQHTCYGIQLKMDNQTYPLLRQHNKHIMDLVYSRKYTQKVINNINQCQIFLRALLLSDITTVDGIYINIKHYTYSVASPIPIKGTNVWAMNKPNKSLWHYWTQFLNTITTRDSRRLIQPLGE
jgi:hypothetical protein